MGLLNRANQETPPFWKKVRNAAAIIAAIAGAITVAPLGIPAAAITVVANIGIIAASVAGTAQCTVKGE